MSHLQVELEAVRPDGAGKAEEEYRLSVALLPLRLRIDQNMVGFLQAFFAASEASQGRQEEESNPELAATATPAVPSPDGNRFFAYPPYSLVITKRQEHFFPSINETVLQALNSIFVL